MNGDVPKANAGFLEEAPAYRKTSGAARASGTLLALALALAAALAAARAA